jgi:hypothetical protein
MIVMTALVATIFTPTVQTAKAAISWTQLTFYDTNPSGEKLKPNISCDGNLVFYIHACGTNTCESENQDGGSIYEVNLSNNAKRRVLKGTLDGDGAIYVSSNNDGAILALATSVDLNNDLTGEALGHQQIYVYIRSINTFERLTAYETTEDLQPNISCNGNVVCWTSQADPLNPSAGSTTPSRGYCFNRTTQTISPITSGIDHTTFIYPSNDGTKFVVASRELLSGTLPVGFENTQQIYFSANSGNTWQNITLIENTAINFEPYLSKDESRVVFAQIGQLLDGSSESRKIAFVYSFSTGLVTRLFAIDDQLPPATIADYVSINSDGSKVVVRSSIDLDSSGSLVSDGVFSGSSTPSDLVVQSGSPVDLRVCDPLGRCVTKNNTSQIPEASCNEFDFDGTGNGHLNDRVTIDPRIAGDYTVEIIPEDGAPPDAPYSLRVVSNDTLILNEAATIETIPPQPYQIDVPPPQFSSDLRQAYIGSASGKLNFKGFLSAGETAGDVKLVISDGVNAVELPLDNTANYQNLNSRLITKTFIDSEAKIRVRAKRPVIGNRWQIIIKGSKLGTSAIYGLDTFASTPTPANVTWELSFAAGEYIATKKMVRNRKGDLVVAR